MILQIKKQISYTIDQNQDTLKNLTFPQQFRLSPIIGNYCFYDSAKTIRDKIYLLPSLMRVNLQSPEYINLTSKSNWMYEWNESTTVLQFDLTISTYIPYSGYVDLEVRGVCPNSFKFIQYNLSIAVSDKNWFSLQPTNSISNTNRNLYLQYPFSNDNNVIVGIGITGLSIYSQNFSSITTTAGS